MSRYKFTCTSKSGECIVGERDDHVLKFNRDELMQRIMSTIAKFVQQEKIPWDPFNIELVVKAQIEPKL